MDKKRYYLDDFVLVVEFDAEALPDCDFQGEVESDGGGMRVKFGRVSGEVYGYRAGEKANVIVVPCDHHGMMPGRLGIRVRYDLPDSSLGDGMRRIVREYVTDVRLTSEMSAGCVPGRIEVTLGAPFAIVRDTDVYAEVLDKVNGVLAGLLDGSGEAGKPKKKVSSFRISEWLTPGMMRNTARPGMVYRLGSKGWGCAVAIGTGRKSKGQIDLSKLFPGGKFYDFPISVHQRSGFSDWKGNSPELGTVDYDPETGIVTYDFSAVQGQLCKFPIEANIIGDDVDPSAQVMINEEGRLVYAPQRLSFMPAPTFEFIGEFNNDGHEGTKNEPRKPHTAQADDGRKLEVMRHRTRRLYNTNIVRGQWRHIYGDGLDYALIVKVRYKSRRGRRTPWRLFLRPKTKSGCRTVVGELK